MKRGLWILLGLSLALNIGFLSAAFAHWSDVHRGAPPPLPGMESPAPGMAPIVPGAPGMGGMGRRGRGPWFGERPPRLVHQWPERRVDRLTQALDLTPEQQQRLRASLEELRGAVRNQTEDLRRERMLLREALLAEDRERVHMQAEKVNHLQARLDSLVAEALLREGAIFTPEQRRRVQELEWGPQNEGAGRILERSNRP